MLTLVTATVGLMIMGTTWIVNRQLDLRPVYIAMPSGAGEEVTESFVPAWSDTYELEVELREPAESDVFANYIKTTGPGEFDATWTARDADGEFASGSLAVYHYVSMTGPRRRQVLRLLGLDSYRNINAFRLSRGIGRFQATAGDEIHITLANHAELPESVRTGEPHFVVRLNRRLLTLYFRRSFALWLCGGGLVLIAVVMQGINMLRRRTSGD